MVRQLAKELDLIQTDAATTMAIDLLQYKLITANNTVWAKRKLQIKQDEAKKNEQV